MARQEYKFDPNQLSLNPVQRSLKKLLTRVGSYMLLSLSIGTLGFFLTSGIVKTPREKNLLSQNEKLLSLYNSLDERLDVYDQTLTTLRILDDSIYRSLIGKKALPWSLREAGTGGHDPSYDLTLSGYPDKVTNTARRINGLDFHLKIQENSYKEVIKEAFSNQDRLNHLPAIMPIYNEDLLLTGSGFGMRFHPILKVWRLHEGIDFYAYTGTDVFATGDGYVRAAQYSETFGNVIIIDHGYGIRTYYAHLSKFDVKRGQRVKRGTCDRESWEYGTFQRAALTL